MRVKVIYVLDMPPRSEQFNMVLLQKEKMWMYELGAPSPKGPKLELNLQIFLYGSWSIGKVAKWLLC